MPKGIKFQRITFILNQPLESPSSIGRYLPMAKQLVKQGFKVKFIALHHDYKNLKLREFTKDGIKVKYVGQMQVLKRGDENFYYNPLMLAWVLIKGFFAFVYEGLKTDTDLIILGKPQAVNGSAALLLKWIKGKPFVIDSDDYEAYSNNFYSKYQTGVFKFFEDNLVKFADIVTCATKYLEKRNKSLVKDKSKVIYLATGINDGSYLKPDKKKVKDIIQKYNLQGKKVIMYVGSISLNGHALDTLIDSFVKVQKKVKNCVLMFVGGGAAFNQMKDYAKRKGIMKRTIFTGWVNHSEIKNFVSVADVTVDPIKNTMASRAKSSVKILESIALGIPVVSMRCGDRIYTLDNSKAGVLTGFGSDNLADGLVDIMNNNKKRKDMGEYAKNHAKKYYWSNLINIFLDKLKGL